MPFCLFVTSSLRSFPTESLPTHHQQFRGSRSSQTHGAWFASQELARSLGVHVTTIRNWNGTEQLLPCHPRSRSPSSSATPRRRIRAPCGKARCVPAPHPPVTHSCRKDTIDGTSLRSAYASCRPRSRSLAARTLSTNGWGKDLAERIAAGSYRAALARSTRRRRSTWYRDYIEALVQRDVRDLARIRSLDISSRPPSRILAARTRRSEL